MSTAFIPFHRPSIGEDEVREVEDTLRSGWLTTGPKTQQFEQEFRDSAGASYSVAVNSATAGLHLALAGLYIGPGDEVITTPVTFCSTVHTILHAGATPVLADVGPDGNIDPEQIRRAITPRTRAIVPVHLAGLPCDMRSIWSLAERHQLHVIEDAAHAVGAEYMGRPIGCSREGEPSSDAVVFSFYATKNLTTGEGGMVTTGREPLACRIRQLSLHGVTNDAWKRYARDGNWRYDVVALGFKYNLSDIQSAIGIHQLRKLDHFIETRARYAAIYNDALKDLEEVEVPPDNPRCRHAWHLYILRLRLEKLSIDREDFMQELRRKQIGTSVHFIPIPLHSFFARLPLSQSTCPAALRLYPRIISLPLYPAMSEEQVHYVASSVRDIVRRVRKAKAFAFH